ncbi:MAG: DEAD/DEAH box helicase [Candidatus Binatia bacterium]|nr:DEAD/DEAH box helicase [Candidatus Binatia bacterium]MDG2008795.1 DEAD/DEAH box helicase [Candidatus Binatia bacterium]
MSRLVDRNLSSTPTDPKELEQRRLARGKAFEHEVDLEALADEAINPGVADLLDETFEAWRRRGPLRPLGDARYVVRVEPPGENVFDDPARLRIEVHPPGEKRPFTPDDLDGRRLPAREWRVFESLVRSPVGQRDFLAENENACLFLARAAEADLILEAPGEDGEIKFDEIVRKPSLVFRAAEPGEAERHPILQERRAEVVEEKERLEKARSAYEDEFGETGRRAFARLLGLPEEQDAEELEEKTYVMEAFWERPDGSDGIPFEEAILLRGSTSWIYSPPRRTFARLAEDVGPIALSRLSSQPWITFTESEIRELPVLLRQSFEEEGVHLPPREALGLPPLPRPRISLEVEGTAFEVRALLRANYADKSYVLNNETVADIDDETRDADRERRALALLAATPLRLPAVSRRKKTKPSPEDEATWRARDDRAVRFYLHDLRELVRKVGEDNDLQEVLTPPDIGKIVARGSLRSSMSVRQGRGRLLDVALKIAADGVEADVDAIRDALGARRRWVQLSDGSVAELGDKVASLAASLPEALSETGSAELSRTALGELEHLGELTDSVELEPTVGEWIHRLRELEVAAEPEMAPGLNADLRPYQLTGLAWLQFLAELELGGILADDMGLGKTVQTLALLNWRKHRDGQAPTLVVAPTSVAPNWIREAKKFTPGINGVLLHGAERHERYEDVGTSDMVVTTYALLRRDVDRLKDIPFRYVVLDEAQHIKNHTAATTAAAKALSAEARLGLTGTPVENRLLELWSILDFANAGMLGTWRNFSRRYERPVTEAVIEAGENRAAPSPARSEEAAALRARIRPFVLRRTKQEVQSDLPAKVETDVVVQLTPEQRKAYAALAEATRADLEGRLDNGGLDANRMLVLTALLRLRQMACDPRLIDASQKPDHSAKLGAFRELVAEVVASGRRALVFSQFVEFLSLLRKELEASGTEYAYLDGRTRNREKVLDGFRDGDMPVFLLSLKAGGTGINLAAADVVIHMDPWWNPAVEDQATDRAHRIGQTRTVSVYRIVAQGTIEEGIQRMKEEKRALARAVIDESETTLPRLTEEDIRELIAFG